MKCVENVLSFRDARALVEREARLVSVPECERVSLREARGRVLAEEVMADRDLPPFDRSTRDGYALSSRDAQPGATFRVIGTIAAGRSLDHAVDQRECVEIMTGAPVPEGCDAVAMLEHTQRSGNELTLSRPLQPQENVVPAGAEAKAGDVLLHRGRRLEYAELAVCAAAGYPQLAVFRRPRVAILCTGDELVAVEDRPGPAQIRNSNAYSLAAQVESAGGQAILLPIAPDRLEALAELVKTGLSHDLLLLSGGVSVGKFDLVEQALQDRAAEFFFTGARIQPGKPVVFGKAGRTYFFGLPGNPVSTMVTFEVFVRPLLAAIAGGSIPQLPVASAILKSEVKSKTGLTRFLPACMHPAATIFEPPTVEQQRWQGSGDLAALVRANCWLIVPPDREALRAGEAVTVLLR